MTTKMKFKTGLVAQALILGGILFMGLTLPQEVQAKQKTATCKVKTNDIGTIVGRGPSSMEAFEDAAVQCFERRSQLHRMARSQNVDEEAGLTMIDTCANIKCGS